MAPDGTRHNGTWNRTSYSKIVLSQQEIIIMHIMARSIPKMEQ
jgi:hypothetical protein